MNFEEALAKLGLPRDASPKDARRAYLRLLKVNRPEANRNEFIALRDAFESVRFMLEISASVAASGALVGTSIAVADIDPTPTASALDSGAPPAIDRAPAALVPDAHAPTLPDSPNATGGAVVISKSYAIAPQSLDELLDSGDHAGAAALICARFDDLGDVPHGLPSVLVSLRVILSCIASRELPAAGALRARLANWLVRTAREASLGADVIALWVTTRELTDASDALSPEVYVPIAQAALAHNLDQATEPLALLRRSEPRTARDALAVLKRKAPWLATVFGTTLAPKLIRARPSWLGWRRPGAMIIIFVIIRAIGFVARSEPTPSVEPGRPVAAGQVKTQPLDVPVVTNLLTPPNERLKRSLGRFFLDAASSAETFGQCRMPEAVELTRRIRDDVRNGKCEQAKSTMDILRGMSTAYPPDIWSCGEPAVEPFRQSLAKTCAEAELVLGRQDAP